MNSLDVHSLVLATDLIILAVAIAMTFVAWNSRKKHPSTELWMLGFLFKAAGFWGLYLRGSIPDFISQPVANLAIVEGSLMFYAGVQDFAGKRRPWKLVAIASVITFFLFVLYVYPNHSYNLKVATVSLIVGAIDLLIGLTVLEAGTAPMRFAYNWLGIVFLFEAACLACRIVAAIGGPTVQGLSSSTVATLLGFLPIMIVPIGLGFGFITMINSRDKSENQELIMKLETALDNVKTLTGLLPICAACKKIRDDQGSWHQIEVYMERHSQAQFSHGICPDCEKRYFPNARGPR